MMIVAKTQLNNVPECCNECCFLRNDSAAFGSYNSFYDSLDYCELTKREINNIYEFQHFCPLIEVKD